jgi:hypothetical protein
MLIHFNNNNNNYYNDYVIVEFNNNKLKWKQLFINNNYSMDLLNRNYV